VTTGAIDLDSLRNAALRNGRDCAEIAADISPGRWSADQRKFYLDGLAVALAETFPLGPSRFLEFADVIVGTARAAFDSRLAELGITVDPAETRH